MTSSKLHEHEKSSLKPEEFMHKKFRYRAHKRKRDDLEDNAITIIQPPLEQATKENKPKKPAAKRRKTNQFFRPWLDERKKKSPKPKTTKSKTSVPLQVLTATTNNIMTSPYLSNVIRQHPSKQHMEIEEQQCNRNTLVSLQSRCKMQAEQLQLQHQYTAYKQQQAAIIPQSVAMGLYLIKLQKVVLQRQNQLFVFGKQ